MFLAGILLVVVQLGDNGALWSDLCKVDSQGHHCQVCQQDHLRNFHRLRARITSLRPLFSITCHHLEKRVACHDARKEHSGCDSGTLLLELRSRRSASDFEP